VIVVAIPKEFFECDNKEGKPFDAKAYFQAGGMQGK